MGGQTEFKVDYSYSSRELKLESFLLDFAGFDTCDMETLPRLMRPRFGTPAVRGRFRVVQRLAVAAGFPIFFSPGVVRREGDLVQIQTHRQDQPIRCRLTNGACTVSQRRNGDRKGLGTSDCCRA